MNIGQLVMGSVQGVVTITEIGIHIYSMDIRSRQIHGEPQKEHEALGRMVLRVQKSGRHFMIRALAPDLVRMNEPSDAIASQVSRTRRQSRMAKCGYNSFGSLPQCVLYWNCKFTLPRCCG